LRAFDLCGTQNQRILGIGGRLDDAQLADAKGNTSLSYKFQRLREKLREAVVSGELSGKLPASDSSPSDSTSTPNAQQGSY